MSIEEEGYEAGESEGKVYYLRKIGKVAKFTLNRTMMLKRWLNEKPAWGHIHLDDAAHAHVRDCQAELELVAGGVALLETRYNRTVIIQFLHQISGHQK